MKIIFGTVEEMFSELHEKNITEVRLEPIVHHKVVGKKAPMPYHIHQIKVTALIDDKVAEVLIEHHAYPQISAEQVKKEHSAAYSKALEIIDEISAIAKDFKITLKSGFFTETNESFLGSVKKVDFH
jgi:hypothetical protein